MKLLIPIETLPEYKNKDKVPIECYYCYKPFFREVRLVRSLIKGTSLNSYKYCSSLCQSFHSGAKIKINCLNCNKEFIKANSQFIASSNNFCSQSCAAKYNNARRKTGIRRSKAEILIEELIKNDFPNLLVNTNVRDVLSDRLEIDILIPEYNFAIELNGPVHYFPIYGKEKFNKIQNADIKKQIELQQKGYNLIIIDISRLHYWKKAKLYLEEYYDKYIKSVITDLNCCSPDPKSGGIAKLPQ